MVRKHLLFLLASSAVLALSAYAHDDDNGQSGASEDARRGRSVVVVDRHGRVAGAYAFNYPVSTLSGALVVQAGDEVVFVPLAPIDSTGRKAEPQDISTTGTIFYHQTVNCSDSRLTTPAGTVLAPVPANDWAGLLFFPDTSATPVTSSFINAEEILAPGQDFTLPGACVPVPPGTIGAAIAVKTFSIKQFAPPFSLQVK